MSGDTNSALEVAQDALAYAQRLADPAARAPVYQEASAAALVAIAERLGSIDESLGSIDESLGMLAAIEVARMEMYGEGDPELFPVERRRVQDTKPL